VMITGAGCSVASGIPTYRDEQGIWQRTNPIQHQEFVTSYASRQRYWARSLAGWPAVAAAEPNTIHRALQTLENHGLCRLLVTQNVDRLHQRAGHQNVVDLHGRLDRVVCLDCHHELTREDMQIQLLALNGADNIVPQELAPDGDADVPDNIIEQFQVPPCDHCGGVLKPDVVFYGGAVPKDRVKHIFDTIDDAAGVLVVGSSLMVFSSFRFCRHASIQNKPIAIVNAGKTRADDIASIKLHYRGEDILPAALNKLTAIESAP
jgi:NAD-dependent SIR2 family protein deacetylase